MTLKDWLEREALTPSQFGARIDRSGEAVRRYAIGTRIPDRETMPLIARETRFAVTANDFFGIGGGECLSHSGADTSTNVDSAPGKFCDLAAHPAEAQS